MVAACVFLACKGCGGKLSLQQAASPIRVSASTVKRQVTVVKKLLLQLAKRFICYMSDIESLKDLDRYLEATAPKDSSLVRCCPPDHPIAAGYSQGIEPTDLAEIMHRCFVPRPSESGHHYRVRADPCHHQPLRACSRGGTGLPKGPGPPIPSP